MGTDLINWGELSRLLTGNRQSVRKDRIPKKYARKVKDFIDAVQKAKNRLI